MANYIKEKLVEGYKGKFVIHLHNATGEHFDLRLEFPVKSLRDSLQEYHEKRVFDKTKEPKPKFPDKPGNVLRSWAIPKHKMPTDKPLLATETEDHNIDYGSFEGTIPEGEYGAGTVEIYDKGTFELVKVEYDKKYVIKMNGEKVKGYYALIKTSGKKFLLIKVKNTEEYEKKAFKQAELLRNNISEDPTKVKFGYEDQKHLLQTSLTHGSVRDCYENTRKEYFAHKKLNQNPKYIVGNLYGIDFNDYTGAYGFDGVGLHHAWVEVNGKIYDATPFKFGRGDFEYLDEHMAEKHFYKIHYKKIYEVPEKNLQNKLDFFPKRSFINSASKIVSNEEVYNMVQRIHKKPEDFYEGDIAKRLDAYDNYELKNIDINLIDLEEWNINEGYVDTLIKQIEQKHEYQPIVLTHDFSIIDGIHRANALKSLGYSKINVYIGMKNKRRSFINSEQIIKEVIANLNPLIVKRDYGVQGHDALEQQALTLEQQGMLPENLKKEMGDRLKPFPARRASIIEKLILAIL